MVASLPKLKSGKKNSSKRGFKEASRECYHEVLRNLLLSLKNSQEGGGFRAKRVICARIFDVIVTKILLKLSLTSSTRQDRCMSSIFGPSCALS